MSNINALCKQLVEHVNNGDLMTALDFFESSMLPYHSKMSPEENQTLYKLITQLDTTVEGEDWNESLEVVDKIAENLNG